MYLPWYRRVRLQKYLRTLRVERPAKLFKLVKLYYAVTDVCSYDEARQSVSETTFVQDIEQ
jgi:hypothetical protein